MNLNISSELETRDIATEQNTVDGFLIDCRDQQNTILKKISNTDKMDWSYNNIFIHRGHTWHLFHSSDIYNARLFTGKFVHRQSNSMRLHLKVSSSV